MSKMEEKKVIIITIDSSFFFLVFYIFYRVVLSGCIECPNVFCIFILFLRVGPALSWAAHGHVQVFFFFSCFFVFFSRSDEAVACVVEQKKNSLFL